MNVEKLWRIYLQTTRNYFLVMFTKCEVPLRMEKGQCGFCFQNKQETSKELLNYFFTACFKHTIWKVIIWQYVYLFTENSSISQNQSGFKPGDSCTKQLLPIMHQIYKSFDDGHEVWPVFFKVKQNDLSGNLLSTLTDFLKLRKQRVVLNVQPSSWSNIKSGMP